MKLLFVSTCATWPLTWGDHLLAYHITHGLVAAGHTVDLIGFTNLPTPETSDPAGVGLSNAAHLRRAWLLPSAPIPRPLYVTRLAGLHPRFPRHAGQSAAPAFWQQIERWVADGGYDGVHVLGGLRVYEYHGALHGLPALIQPFDSSSLLFGGHFAHSHHPRHAAEWVISRAYEGFMYRPYRSTVFVAQRDADYVTRLAPGLPTQVIANGVDTGYFTPPPAPARDPYQMVFVGNLGYAPNVDAAHLLATEVLPRVRAVFPNAALDLVGTNPSAAVQALAAPGVTVTGWVDDVRPYLARAGVFVAPLVLGAGIKNKILEALAAGVPVAGTPEALSGIAAHDQQHARIARVDALADAVIALMRDPAGAAAMAGRGRDLVVREYSWHAAIGHYEALYDRVLRG